ncbi:glycosyltransferase [Oceanispirochaeta sp.]|uniref:glycosyltransferase n=1 Tax=Oceanispirochaeta sp. TaxID=2035350 RepID=UPI00261DF1F9|nr:glycosyltransferase [Oceanispirochaeta sp.]MDA3956817.1 glycosyltransferase [Oceanispirochaeta sp.]
MKIAIFSDAYYPQINGVVTSINSIARNMADRGHKVIIVAPSYKNLQEQEYPGIKIIRVTSISASFYDDFRWTNPFSYIAYRALKDEAVDIIHFMTPVFISLLGIKFARKLNLPLVATFHTFIANPLYFEHLFKGPLKITEEVSWKYLNLYYDCADYVSAPTEEAVKIIRENHCTAPLEAISNGIDFNIFDNTRSPEFKKCWGLGDKVILYVGRVAFEKNLRNLMDSFDLVYKTHPDAQLLIIGDGPQLEEFEKYASLKESRKKIIFTGAIPHNDLVVSGVFEAVSLFATASQTETQGITLLEAQANGLICVGVREGGIINLIEDGKNGYLVSPGDVDEMAEKLAYILENKASLGSMELAAKEMVDVHKMSRIIDRWEELYQNLIDNKENLPVKDYLHFSALMKFTTQFKIDFRYFLKKIRPSRTFVARNPEFKRRPYRYRNIRSKAPVSSTKLKKIRSFRSGQRD